MASSKLHPDSAILIIGAGVFGLSTALWLARGGYKNVTVVDMQDTAASGYNPDTVDSASADINKIIRFSYGAEIDYQRLAMQAAAEWEDWNNQFAATTDASGLPADLRPDGAGLGERKLWRNCGMLRMSDGYQLSEVELRTLENMEKEGIREFQFRTDDPIDIDRAEKRQWGHKMDPCHRQERFGVHKAVLDSTAGFVVAYKSCSWAKYLAEKAGVKFILDPLRGKVIDISRSGDAVHEETPLVKTADGGGWTPSLLPEVSQLLETTAGSVVTIRVPQERQDLWERYSASNFPVITWRMDEGNGIYSFPRDEEGIVKIGYRKTKWTNYDDVNGLRISVPKTAHVTEKKETRIPITALEGIKGKLTHSWPEYIMTNLPDLAEFGLHSTKLCWYTDSIDNSFLVDYVPGRPGVAVCSGGSGHGFKFLPILGREVVKILEGQGESTPYGKLWGWRGADMTKGRNGLEEGEDGPRVLAKHRMASPQDWKI
ncbi:related to fructosyl amino acid oxidase [Cephalotrichum gorgonifer]|uniref:Related to fructosyl amino acid oxidase n=1 Tax=Cephalotrichum gorgonifer TaxID=2041049 RepID=A0AAE8MTA3_9PEZI|nr:related to fructosyl amino acid oxidase [Cephalotrichum gorgonifer]